MFNNYSEKIELLNIGISNKVLHLSDLYGTPYTYDIISKLSIMSITFSQ